MSSPRDATPLVTGAHDATERLRDRVEHELRLAGFVWHGTRLVPPEGDPKEVARRLHGQQRARVLAKSADFVKEWEERLLPSFASGAEVNPASIAPSVRPVVTEEDAALFRYASLSWSVPVSQGYGRRTRFLMWDEHNGKLMGIFAMGDPVFNLRVRDNVIGWTTADRKERLYNVFDAFVLGAVEPYRQLLGGKMAALATVAEETTAVLTEKYRGTKTTIQGAEKPPRPVLVTTTSSLGRSSIYNRLAFEGRRVFVSVGFTEGYGHFQFSDDLFTELVRHVEQSRELRGNQYGQGPNWKIRTLRTALESLDLPGDLLRHGLRREVFLAPLGVAWRAFLRGETDQVRWYPYQLDDLAEHFRTRWAVPRGERRSEWRQFDPDSVRISAELPRLYADRN
jgi:hypothetical protein